MDSLVEGFTKDKDEQFIDKNLGKHFIITTEDSLTGQRSYGFEDFRKLALNLRIIQHNKKNIVVKVIKESTVELIMALMSNSDIYHQDLFLFKMYPFLI